MPSANKAHALAQQLVGKLLQPCAPLTGVAAAPVDATDAACCAKNPVLCCIRQACTSPYWQAMPGSRVVCWRSSRCQWYTDAASCPAPCLLHANSKAASASARLLHSNHRAYTIRCFNPNARPRRPACAQATNLSVIGHAPDPVVSHLAYFLM